MCVCVCVCVHSVRSDSPILLPLLLLKDILRDGIDQHQIRHLPVERGREREREREKERARERKRERERERDYTASYEDFQY